MIFGFSICALPLQVTLVTYFGLELGTLEDGQPLEGSKACYYNNYMYNTLYDIISSRSFYCFLLCHVIV